jgi:DNA-binding GntR family transcriptional regulator
MRRDFPKNNVSLDESLRIERNLPTLREQVLEKLRTAIVEMRFQPGERLVERKLCELLGVSRTSVREALRHLESEGLVRTVPHKGPVVALPTAEEARDLYEVRVALEGLAGELFVRNATDAQCQALFARFQALSDAASRNDVQAAYQAGSQFYQALIAGIGNQLCAEMFRGILARAAHLRIISAGAPGRLPIIVAELHSVIDAITNRDPDAARRACTAHVQSAAETVLARLAKA